MIIEHGSMIFYFKPNASIPAEDFNFLETTRRKFTGDPSGVMKTYDTIARASTHIIRKLHWLSVPYEREIMDRISKQIERDMQSALVLENRRSKRCMNMHRSK